MSLFFDKLIAFHSFGHGNKKNPHKKRCKNIFYNCNYFDSMNKKTTFFICPLQTFVTANIPSIGALVPPALLENILHDQQEVFDQKCIFKFQKCGNISHPVVF